MQVIHYPDDPRPARWHQPVLALGNFDGMHRGHLKIIERVRRGAEERSATAVAMTFDPHPSKIVRPDKAPPLLMTNQQKLDALARAGMHGVAIVRFTAELAQWDPETFVRTVLVEWLHVAEVWVGANFLFGHDRAGTFSMLRSLGARYGFRAEKIDPVRYKDFVVSSTRIRRLITEGRVDEAGALLGHHYAIEGAVVIGQKRGRGLGFPTANLCVENELVPPHGVYATTAVLSGMAYPSITNIGTRPTFESGEESVVETHLLNFDKDLYDAHIKVGFVQRLRDERKFDGIESLKKQIEADRDHALDLFDRMGL
jgi:riboflavin kinase / FMN adenylyltransferase